MKLTNKYVFFWGGIYSQWHLADMEIGGVVYNSCEQYMMHQKALLFQDWEIAARILEESNPREQKKFGRRIRHFDKEIWDSRCLGIVYRGNLAKFSQNPELKKALLETGNKIFVEASPYDKIWGIGMAEDEPGIEDPANWRGINLLGQAITLVKMELSSK